MWGAGIFALMGVAAAKAGSAVWLSFAATAGALSMSALGQKQTFERPSVMSALPPRADIFRGGVDVR